MSMYLGSQTCGNTYGSCIGDPPKPLESHVIIIIIIVVSIVFALAVGGCTYYCRMQQRKQARAQLARQMRGIITQSQVRHIYYINPGPLIAAQTPIQDTSSPTYEQAAPKTIGN